MTSVARPASTSAVDRHARRHVSRARSERPRRARRGVQQGGEGAQRPPHPGRPAERLDLGLAPGLSEQLQQPGDQGVGVGGRQPLGREAVVVEPGRPQVRQHRRVEGRVVVGGDGVEGDAHDRCLHDRPVGEGVVEARAVEPFDAVPQPEVRRGGLLRLQRDDPAHGVGRVDRLPPQQQLPRQRRPVQLGGGQRHARQVALAPRRPGRAVGGEVRRMSAGRARHGLWFGLWGVSGEDGRGLHGRDLDRRDRFEPCDPLSARLLLGAGPGPDGRLRWTARLPLHRLAGGREPHVAVLTIPSGRQPAR